MQRVGVLVAHHKDGFYSVPTDTIIKLQLLQLIQKSIFCYRLFYNSSRSILKTIAILTTGAKSTGNYSCTLEMITNKSLIKVSIIFSTILTIIVVFTNKI